MLVSWEREFRASVLSLQLKPKQVQTNEIKKWFNISDHTERIKVKNTIITPFPHLDGATSSQGNRGRSFSSCLLSADASPLIRSLCLKLHVRKWICSPSRRALIIFQRKKSNCAIKRKCGMSQCPGKCSVVRKSHLRSVCSPSPSEASIRPPAVVVNGQIDAKKQRRRRSVGSLAVGSSLNDIIWPAGTRLHNPATAQLRNSCTFKRFHLSSKRLLLIKIKWLLF